MTNERVRTVGQLGAKYTKLPCAGSGSGFGADITEVDGMLDETKLAVVLKRFDSPGEVREFPKGRFEIVRLAGMTIGRAVYEPGWRWSTDVGEAMGKTRCEVEHVGMVISGCATAAFEDGSVTEMHAGDLFHIGGVPHDSWVVGNEPYVSLHFLGGDHYATKPPRP